MKQTSSDDPLIIDPSLVDVSSLHAHPRNARRGDVKAIAESLARHGQYRPIVVNKSTMEILAGNHTWQAAQQLAWTQIAVTFVDVDEDEALRILLIDNKLNDDARYDDTSLVDLLRDLAVSDQALEGTGFDADELDSLIARLEPPDADAQGITDYDERYEVVIECENEVHQKELLERLNAEGMKVRALIV